MHTVQDLAAGAMHRKGLNLLGSAAVSCTADLPRRLGDGVQDSELHLRRPEVG